MKEKILSITELHDYKFPDDKYSPIYGGYKITTCKQDILILIDEDQQCCEQAGYLCSEDSLEDFYDAILTNIYITDEKLINEDILESMEAEAIFVNLETTNGKLQFAVYNCHNGYYGHKVFIRFNEVMKTQYL